MKDKIWYEMVNMKYLEIYLGKYLSFQRTVKKAFKIFTLVASISGILGWKYFENYISIVLALIALIQILLLVESEIIRSDKEIEEISNLRMMCTRYFNKLERLWNESFFEMIPDIDAMNKYFDLRVSDWERIEEINCRINIKEYRFFSKDTERKTNLYLNKYHNYEQ